jgi:hypothetical protein
MLLISFLQIFAFRDPQSIFIEIGSQIGSLWSVAEIGSALFNPKRRAIHDFLARTVCVKD